MEVRDVGTVLDAGTWRARAAAYAARVDDYTRAHLARRESGQPHPVHDFLFTYYGHRPAQLRRWHPGFGVALADAEEYADLKGYEGSDGLVSGSVSVSVSPTYLEAQRPLVRQLHTLLVATAGRPATYGCFGLHEWAMVYRQDPGDTRHPRPLRLGPRGTDEVVEGSRITCSHFDAFRFFTPPARGLNLLQPGRDDRPAYEQPGCLHATMDLYKHAFRLTPLIESGLVMDCFELAWDVRVTDMRAAPYDLTGVRLDRTGEEWTPIRIETTEGKAEYAAAQRAFAVRAVPLRERLIGECERLLG